VPGNPPFVSLVAAVAENGVIGAHNRLPWHLPADLKHFKQVTLGKPVVMGRKTYESIGRPLPGRTNIVVTQAWDYQATGCVVVHTVEQALAAGAAGGEIMVIGGAALYAACLDTARRIYLTRIHQAFPGDAYFPALAGEQWHETARRDCAPDAANPYAYSFIVLERTETAPRRSP
jgi:dihydrofolate reductase